MTDHLEIKRASISLGLLLIAARTPIDERSSRDNASLNFLGATLLAARPPIDEIPSRDKEILNLLGVTSYSI